MLHSESQSIHMGAYVQSADPGAVGAKVLWIDTTSGYVLKKRTDADDGWDTIADLSTAGAGIPETLIDALGDLIYGSAADTAAKLAGNTTTTKKFLTQTGDGADSAAPGWDTIASGDVPDLSGTYIAKAFMAAKGDLIAASANDTPAILSVGTDGLALVAASGETAGLKYATPHALIATETGTTRTLATADAGKYIRYTNAAGCAITVPDNSDDPIPVGSEFHGIGTQEQLEFVEDTSVTINFPASASLFTAEAFSVFTLKKVGTDEWDLMGYLEPA